MKSPLKTLGTAAASVTLIAGAGLVATAPHADAAITRYCRTTSSQPTLSYGSSGPAVSQAQCEINTTVFGASLSVDGKFGPATLAAVKRVQYCAHIQQDGIIGPNTWSVLNYWSNTTSWLCNR